MKDSAAILEKAKKTEYKHPSWFKEGGKSVYEAVEYFVRCGDFSIDLVNSIKWASEIPGLSTDGFFLDKKTAIKHCIRTEQYDKLIIRYNGRERGTDRGKLKIQTFLILLEEDKKKKN